MTAAEKSAVGIVGASLVLGIVSFASFVAGYRMSSSVWEEATGLRLVHQAVPATNWVTAVRSDGRPL